MFKLIKVDKDKKYSDEFLYFLLEKMERQGIIDYKPEKTIQAEFYLNTTNLFNFKDYIKTSDIILDGIYNIKWERYKDRVIYLIDNDKYVKGSSAKLNVVCKLINDGNLDLQPYPLFSNLFEKFEKDFDAWYDYYQNGGF